MFVNKRQQLLQHKKVELPVKRRGFQAADNSKSLKISQVQGPKIEKKTLDWDDISLSSEDSKSFTKFLKKPDSSKEEKINRKDAGPAFISQERPKSSRGSVNLKSHIAKGQSSSAVDRLVQIEARFRDRQQKNRVSMSTSDFDLDISSDSEIKRDIGKSDVNLREKVKKSAALKSPKKFSNQIFLSVDDDLTASSESDSSPLHKFMKGNVALTFFDDESNKSELEDRLAKTAEHGKKSSQQYFRNPDASTDFESSDVSMHEYMKNLDEEKISRPSISKKVTFATDLVRSSNLEKSRDDILPESECSKDMNSLEEVVSSKLQNVMSLDELFPVEDLQKDSKKLSSSITFNIADLHSVEELLPSVEVRSSTEYITSMEEDIECETTPRSLSTSYSENQDVANLHSVEKIKLHAESEAEQQKQKPSNIFHADFPDSESQSAEIRSESIHYSEDFHSDDDTLKDTESITQDLSAEQSSVSDRKENRERSVNSSYTSSISYSSNSTMTRSPSPVPRKQKSKKTGHMETQTGPWIPGSVYTDMPSFKPTRLMDHEMLDILTAYNPASLAIQDLLQQQVHLTREFIARSKRLHEMAVTSIPCDYVYGEVNSVTLEQLKKIWQATEEQSLSTT